MAIKLIVGLRNPGSAYAETRHNVGAWFVEALAQKYGASFKPVKKLQAELASLQLDDVSCYVLLPQTFMNLSGLAVRAVAQFYRIEPDEILIAHDDLDLPVGRIKLKTGGGHGGHNGLRDIIAQLGGSHFHRLRIGISHPGHKDLVLEYVLGKPSQADRIHIVSAIDASLPVVPTLLTGSVSKAMSELGNLL